MKLAECNAAIEAGQSCIMGCFVFGIAGEKPCIDKAEGLLNMTLPMSFHKRANCVSALQLETCHACNACAEMLKALAIHLSASLSAMMM